MGQKIFVPLTDEMLYDHPELITAPLRPFNAGQPCFHWMATWMANAEIEISESPEPSHEPTNGAGRLIRPTGLVHTGSKLA